MIPVPVGQVVFALFLAAFGSLFAAADVAMGALQEGRLQALVVGEGWEARQLSRYAEDKLRVLSRWLVARIVCIAIASALLADAADRAFTVRIGTLVAVLGAVGTYGTCVEILGTFARRRPEKAGAWALRILRPFELAVMPLAVPLTLLGRVVDRRLPEAPPPDNARLTETEVEWVVAEGEKAGAIAEEPAEMIRNVLDFKDLTAKEVMVPRRKISGLEIGTSLEKVLDFVSREGHSRYPVYRETLDNVVGLLYAKDLFEVVGNKQLQATTLAGLVRKQVLFVVETQSALSVLREMRSKRLHMAIVSDEFGGTAGLVTLEDIIEEIVGEIQDEHDTEDDTQIQELDDGRFVADAAIPLADLEAHLGREFPADGDFESLGGLILHREGRVPPVGTTLELDGFKLIVREADETRVVKVEIVPSVPPPAEAAAS
jgi:CBS domain containing-hemolysin-like protein